MSELNEATLRIKVQEVLGQLKENPLGLRLADVHQVDGRWWVFLDVVKEPPIRAQVWDAVADIERRLEDQNVQALVTAA